MQARLDAIAATPDEAEVVAQLLVSIDRFLERQSVGLRVDAARGIHASLIEGLGELGVFGATIPTEWGGAGLSLHAAGSLVAGIARHDRAIATTVGLHLGLGTRGLIALGTPAQQARWLPALASGVTLAAFATTEAGAGSDLMAVRTSARRDGERILVSGEKIFVTNGGFAGLFTVVAATPGMGGKAGHSLLLVQRGDGGVSIGAEEHKLGIRGSSTVTLYLDETSLSADRVLGQPGAGMRHLQDILSWGRTLMAAGCIGTARAAVDATVHHVRTRRQFGRALADMPVVRAQIATMAASIYAMEAIVRWAASDPSALPARSLSAKVLCSELSWECVDLAVQLHGGSGFIEDTGIPLLLRDARIPRIFEGANDVLLGHLGLLEAGAPRPSHSAVGLRVSDLRTHLVRQFGVHLVRHPIPLRRLGTASAIRDGTEAVRERTPCALGEHAQSLLEARADACLRAHSTDDTWQAVADSVLQ